MLCECHPNQGRREISDGGSLPKGGGTEESSAQVSACSASVTASGNEKMLQTLSPLLQIWGTSDNIHPGKYIVIQSSECMMYKVSRMVPF
jgi:hypothetical protein